MTAPWQKPFVSKNTLLNLLRNKLFMLTTFLPTLVSIVYFGFVSSDVYISESRFVVRSPERQSSSPFGVLLKGAGFSKAQEDSYTVQDYILSRDAIKALNEELNIKEKYSADSIDRVSRFSGLDFDDSLEAFYPYYLRKVTVQLDSASSISTLSTRAYTAEDAYKINQRLVEFAESFVNRLNERGRQDMIQFSLDEVAEAQKKARSASLAIAAYRDEKGVIDPEKQSSIPLQQIAKLQDELISIRAQVLQLEKLAPDNPQLPVLRQRVTLLEKEIQSEINGVTGGERSLAGKVTEFHRLALEKEFADKMVTSAMSSLEQARSEVLRKQLYLERVVQPSFPDMATEPKRLRNIVVTFIVAMIIWGIFSMLIAGIKEHYE